MKRSFMTFLLFFVGTFLYGQTSFENLKMGDSDKTWQNKGRDVSNPNSWEETSFLLDEPAIFSGKKSIETQISFWNHRLYSIRMTFNTNDWLNISNTLSQIYGKPWKIDSLKKEGYWGDTRKGAYSYISGSNIAIVVSDETQKDFHWQDLFRGMLFYIILVIVGLFVLYFLVAYLITSFCPQCKSFSMELSGGVELSNTKDYNTSISPLSTPQIEYDRTYTHKCKKCGYIRKDKYSGWWANYRKNK